MQQRLPVPLPVKRQLRKEAGFGCCQCGRPIIEYHHIVPYTATDPHFPPEDMMCLCPYCHHEATVGAMTVEEQRRWKAHPFNIKRNRAKGLLKINQKSLVVGIGTAEFINDHEVIVIDGETMLQLKRSEAGTLDVSVKLYDRDNKLLLDIVDNEWVSGDYLPWDIECGFQHITLRERKSRITLDIDARKEFISLRGTLLYNGVEIRLTNNGVLSYNLQMQNVCVVGSTISLDTRAKTVSIGVHPVYGQSKIVIDPDRATRIRKGLRLFALLQAESGVSPDDRA